MKFPFMEVGKVTGEPVETLLSLVADPSLKSTNLLRLT